MTTTRTEQTFDTDEVVDLNARRERPRPPVGTHPEDMKQVHLECHAEGHWWKMAGDTDLTYGPGGYLLSFTRNYICQRRVGASQCKETKKIRRSLAFNIESSGYKQPPGFRMERDDKAVSTKYTALAELLAREGVRLQ